MSGSSMDWFELSCASQLQIANLFAGPIRGAVHPEALGKDGYGESLASHYAPLRVLSSPSRKQTLFKLPLSVTKRLG